MDVGSKESLYDKLVRCSKLGEVVERLRFYQKPKLWESMGVVFREGYFGATGKDVLLKVQPILKDVCESSGIACVTEYQFVPEGLVCDGQLYDVSDKKERFRIENAFREVKVLDYLARAGLGDRFVQRRYCPDTGQDHELFFAGGDLYLRTLMEQKPGHCLGDRDVRYVNEYEKKFEIMDPRDIVRCAADLAEDLLVLRAHTIFHNDVKRANVLREIGEVPGGSQFHLVDFGSARFNQEIVDTHLLVGTAGYRAPEVMKAYGPNSFSDAWSLGALLYSEIVGQVPFNTHYKEVTSSMVEWARDRLYRAKVPFQYDFLDAVLLLLSDDGRKRDLVGLKDVSLQLLLQGDIYRSSSVDETTKRLQVIKVGDTRAQFKQTAALPTTNLKVEREQKKVTDTFQEGDFDIAALHEALRIKS